MVPAQRDGLLSLGHVQFLQDLLILFSVRQCPGASPLRIEDWRVCVFFLRDTDAFFVIAQTFGFLTRVSLCQVVGRKLGHGFRSLFIAMSGSLARRVMACG